jgi:hypothetical protein
MTTTAVPKQQKKLSLAGCTTTPHVPATLREMETLSSDLCEQVEMLQGLCRTLSVFAYADENLDGLSVKDIGNTALLMGQTLDGVHEGLEKIEDLAAHSSVASHIQKGR